MSNYHFNTKISSGNLANLIEEIDTSAVRNVLVLTSPSVLRNNTTVAFIGMLKKMIPDTVVISNITPDAPIAPLDNIVQENARPDLIIAIGGGSVIDSSKALSVAWQGASIFDLFYKRKRMPTSKIKVFAVPTTAGTGAELSYGAILYDKESKLKGGIRSALIQPDIAFIDIELYKSAPSTLIAEVGFDCFTHAVETYISTASTPIVRYQSIAAIQTVFKNLPDAVNKNKQDLEKVAIAATNMGINLALSSTCLPHRIQYVIGPLTNTSHAQGLIMLYNGWLSEVSATPQYNMLVKDLGLTSNEFINRVSGLKRVLNIDYRLGDCGIPEIDVPAIAARVEGNLKNDPCYSSIDTLINILKNSL